MIAELRPYQAYKPSGVEGLGEVPTHWEVRRLRNVARILFSNVDKHSKNDEIAVRLCNYSDVYYNNRIRSDMNFMDATATAKEIERFRLVSGDVLITKDSESWDDIGVPAFVESSANDLVCGYHLALLRPISGTGTGDFLHRALSCRGIADQFFVRANGVTRFGLSQMAIKSCLLPVPPLPEQTAIARFLDHATSRIERYVRAKEKLIALLEEQKQVVPHDAVTGRIDVRTGKPYVAYKPSGVEWLGEVPAHWEVRRLRNIADVRFSNVDKHAKEDERAVRLCNYSDVYHNDRVRSDMDFMRATATDDEVERFRLATGDVLITKDSETWNDIGVPALVESTGADLVCGYHLALVRPTIESLCGKFLHAALTCPKVAVQLHVCANGVTRFGLSQNSIKSTWLPNPPLPEQTAIVRYLDDAVTKIIRAVDQTDREIELLREYRTRLIADVVTGKLDVREAGTALPAEPAAFVPEGVFSKSVRSRRQDATGTDSA